MGFLIPIEGVRRLEHDFGNSGKLVTLLPSSRVEKAFETDKSRHRKHDILGPRVPQLLLPIEINIYEGFSSSWYISLTSFKLRVKSVYQTLGSLSEAMICGNPGISASRIVFRPSSNNAQWCRENFQLVGDDQTIVGKACTELLPTFLETLLLPPDECKSQRMVNACPTESSYYHPALVAYGSFRNFSCSDEKGRVQAVRRCPKGRLGDSATKGQTASSSIWK